MYRVDRESDVGKSPAGFIATEDAKAGPPIRPFALKKSCWR